jgi:hypothetical protein
MRHPNWHEDVRAGSDCASLMSGYARKREREFRRAGVSRAAETTGDPPQRDLDDWDDSETSLSANGARMDRKRESTWNYLQRELDLSPRQLVWGCAFYALVILAILYLRDRF